MDDDGIKDSDEDENEICYIADLDDGDMQGMKHQVETGGVIICLSQSFDEGYRHETLVHRLT